MTHSSLGRANVGLRIGPDHIRKGQLKMRGLAEEIREFHYACQCVHGTIAPGPTVEISHLDSVVNALDRALVTIRTLDLEVFTRSGDRTYVQLRESLRTGRAVGGLRAPRNQAVHSLEVIDPDLGRAVGPLDGRFIVFPRWKARRLLPKVMFEHRRKPIAGQIDQQLANDYDEAVAGRLVLDTLMDAFAFFDTCSPSLLDRDAKGQVEGFPLTPLEVAGYARLHPDWPSHEDVDERIRSEVTTAPPMGHGRTIKGCFRVRAEVILYGFTDVDGSRTLAFTEPSHQVAADIRQGYPYSLGTSGGTPAIQLDGDVLVSAGKPLLNLIEEEEPPPVPWDGWWSLALDDASYYRAQRQW